MPDNDFMNGGGLTLWGDDVLVMHKSGRIHYLDEAAERLVVSAVLVPDNGHADYEALEETGEYAGRVKD